MAKFWSQKIPVRAAGNLAGVIARIALENSVSRVNGLNHQTPKFMPLLKPDPTFYPSPGLAMQAPPEKHAFVAALNPPGSELNDALLVIDVDSKSATYRPAGRGSEDAKIWR